MKVLISLLTILISLTMTNQLYAKGNSRKDNSRKEKPERRDSEKNKREKNIKAFDAQQNWGKLKYQYDDLDESEQKEMKEQIKAKKRIRNEIRREIDKNPDLNLDSILEYDKESPEDLENLVEKLLNESKDENERTLEELRSAGMSENSINKIENSLSKYNEYPDILEEDMDVDNDKNENDEGDE